MTDINGNVVWSATYTAFGEATVDPTSTITNNFRFPGQYFDEETGKHYNWNRYYDPKTGRYTQVDPIGDSINAYAYVENDPVNFIDAEGLKSARAPRISRTKTAKSRTKSSKPFSLEDIANEKNKKLLENVEKGLSHYEDFKTDRVAGAKLVCVKWTLNPECDPNHPNNKGPWWTSPCNKDCKCIEKVNRKIPFYGFSECDTYSCNSKCNPERDAVKSPVIISSSTKTYCLEWSQVDASWYPAD